MESDDGALVNSSIKPDPNDPAMVQITVTRRKTALDTKGWTGFTSDQL
jgi:hypothetical protein